MTNHLPDSTQFWRGKRVMVTGGNGFLGKNIVRKLRERGAAEIIVSEPSPMLRTSARDLSQHGIRADAIRTDAGE